MFLFFLSNGISRESTAYHDGNREYLLPVSWDMPEELSCDMRQRHHGCICLYVITEILNPGIYSFFTLFKLQILRRLVIAHCLIGIKMEYIAILLLTLFYYFYFFQISLFLYTGKVCSSLLLIFLSLCALYVVANLFGFSFISYYEDYNSKYFED